MTTCYKTKQGKIFDIQQEAEEWENGAFVYLLVYKGGYMVFSTLEVAQKAFKELPTISFVQTIPVWSDYKTVADPPRKSQKLKDQFVENHFEGKVIESTSNTWYKNVLNKAKEYIAMKY